MPNEFSRPSAEFQDDDPRYAEVESKLYPVLLTSFRSGTAYEEDMQDRDEYPIAWRWKFFSQLKTGGMAVIASDSNLDDQWRPLTLNRVSEVQLSNFLSCRIGAKIKSLKFE